MRNYFALIWVVILILSSGCGKKGVDPVEDATDVDAVANIVLFDYGHLFLPDSLATPIPDTLPLELASPYKLEKFWRTVELDSLILMIGEQDTIIEDSVRIVPIRGVTVARHMRGKLEIMATDTSDGESRTVRMSKPYFTSGSVNGTVKKYGFDYNTRRGWLLTDIGNARYSYGDRVVHICSSSHPEDTITPGLGTYPFSLFPVFSNGESLTVLVENLLPSDTIGAVSIKCPTSDGLVWRQLQKNESGTFIGGFRFYDFIYDKHIYIDLIRSRTFERDTSSYHSSAIGVSYNVRQ